MTVKLTSAVATSMVTTEASAAGANATIKIYTATRPANPDTAITSQTLLATLTVPSWGTASSGTSAAGSITNVTAAATGTASWFRLATSGGTTILDGDCGTGTSGDLNFSTLSFVSGGTVAISSFSLTVTAD